MYHAVNHYQGADHLSAGMGAITPEAIRSLGEFGDLSEVGFITPEITRQIGTAPLAQVKEPMTLLTIPVSTWLIVLGAAAAGGSLGAWALTRERKALLGGSLGGILGAGLGVTVIGLMNRRYVQGTVQA